MQVATLFRESAATLLGATGMIESPTAPHSFVPPPSHPPKPPSGTEAPPYTCLDALGAHHQVLPPQDSTAYKMTLEYHHAKSSPFAQNCPLSLSPTTIKHEMPDDGYETSGGDAITPRNSLAPAKCDLQPASEDPYNFIDDDLSHMMSFPSLYGAQAPPDFSPNLNIGSTPKKRGRKKKVRDDLSTGSATAPPKVQRERKKHDRFNGMPEEEVSKRTLPDHLTSNLDIIIIGINPGLFAAYKGHHYAGPGNHFWKCLYLSGLTAEQMSAEEDYKLLNSGIGFTNMVQRATKGSADLTRKEIKEGCRILLDKLRRFRPKIAVFNGKLIFEVFSGKKDFNFGRQPDCIEGTNTYMWVMPSSSARCAQLPRAADKVPFYAALKKFRDYLNGLSPEADLEEQEFVFSDPKYKVCCESEPKTDRCLIDKDDGGGGGGGGVGQEVKKKRGRPKKVRPEDGIMQTTKVNPKRSSPSIDGGSCAKKKRGRPKKLKDSGGGGGRGGGHQECKMEFSSPPPILEAMQQQQHNNNSGSFCKTPTAYQSPQNSQTRDTFSHSDLSSEISAAISSDHLVDSPPAASPPLGPPPDFEPPATMPTDDASHTPDLTLSPYSPYTNTTNATYAHDEHWRAVREQRDVYKVPDVTTKSLSGLENLVDQIPTMGDVDGSHHHHHHHHHQVTNGTIEGGDTMRGDESTNYPSCLYSDRDYESVFAPYGGASYAAFAADSIDVPPPPPPPPAYAAYTSGNFDYTYPGQHPGFGPTPQAPPSPQMVLNPNYAAYAATSYPPPPYPPPPQAQSTVSYRHHAFKPDITGYGGF